MNANRMTAIRWLLGMAAVAIMAVWAAAGSAPAQAGFDGGWVTARLGDNAIQEPCPNQVGDCGDLGDAPDSTNHFGVTMTTYPSAVVARFPTVFDLATGYPPGPYHWWPHENAWLGPEVSVEFDADLLPDFDSGTNIDPNINLADRDYFDDGVDPLATNLSPCNYTSFDYTMTVIGLPMPRYVNVWFDFNRDGDWEDVYDCIDATGNVLVVNEWAVMNQTHSFGPGFHTITTPLFVSDHPPTPNEPLWMRITLSEQSIAPIAGIPSGHDGRGTDWGYEIGETEDYYLQETGGQPDPCQTNPFEECPDLGDAPDSTNHTPVGMTTYPTSVPARFPTVFAGDPVPGPLHKLPLVDAYLGGGVTRELDADWLPDEDAIVNIDPVPNLANQDGKDDGVDFSTLVLPPCGMTTFDYSMTVWGPAVARYTNVWFDFNQDGDWEDVVTCIDNNGSALTMSEWAVQDQVTVFGGAASYLVTTPSFAAQNPYSADNPLMWMRITLSEAPAVTASVPSGADGRGPLSGFQFGETEDYIFDLPPLEEPCPILYLSFHGDGVLDNVFYDDEDIVKRDVCAGTWSMHYDGTANGLPVGADIDGFLLLGNWILMTFETTTVVPSVGSVEPEDIVLRLPSNVYLLIFDGSDVGLSGTNENVDAIALSPNGKLLISLSGPFTAGAVSGDDEDLIEFTVTSWGPSTSGTFGMYFDGSDVELSPGAFEDVWAAHVDASTGDIYLSTMWTYAVTSSSGDGADVFRCTPGSTGSTTTCSYSNYWDGSADGVVNLSVDGMHLVPSQLAPQVTLQGLDLYR